MNRKTLVILLLVAVVLGGAVWLIRQHDQSAFQGAERSDKQKLFADFKYNEVAHVSIKQGSNEVNLVKKDVWRVRERQDYPASFTEVRDFLLKASDLKVAERDAVGGSQLARLELVPGQTGNAPVQVEFKDQSGKTINTLWLGKTQMQKSSSPSPMSEMGDEGIPKGRWVRVGADTNTVALLIEPLNNIAPKAEQWLNKDFFKVEKIKSISVAYPVASNSFSVSRDKETASDWKLADAKPGEQLDASKTSAFNFALSSPSFDDVLPTNTAPQSIGLDKLAVVALDTFDGFTYTIKVGAKTNENYPVTVAIAAPEWIDSNTSTNIPNEAIEKFTGDLLAEQMSSSTTNKDADLEDRLQKKLAEARKTSQAKLAQERACEKWTYLVSSWTLDPLLKERAQLLAQKKDEPIPDAGASTNAVVTPKPSEPAAPDPLPPAP